MTLPYEPSDPFDVKLKKLSRARKNAKNRSYMQKYSAMKREEDLSEFRRKANERQQRWRSANPDAVQKQNKKRYADAMASNPEGVRKHAKDRYAAAKARDPEGYRLRHREANKNYYAKNPEKVRSKRSREKVINPHYHRDYARLRLASDLDFRLRNSLRARQSQALGAGRKAGSAVTDLGCSVGELWVWLEDQFQPGMTRENRGNGPGKWNIDHIIPLSRFNLEDRNEFVRASHYSNLQPLWFKDNLAKGNKLEPPYLWKGPIPPDDFIDFDAEPLK